MRVDSFKVLSKAVRPMPDKFHGLADSEMCYRRRHLDLMSNSESATRFVQRSLQKLAHTGIETSVINGPRLRLPRAREDDIRHTQRRHGAAVDRCLRIERLREPQ